MDKLPPPPAPSQLVISFPGLGSAEAQVKAQNVTPGQIYLAAWLLDAWARELRAGNLAPQPGGLVVARGQLPGGPS